MLPVLLCILSLFIIVFMFLEFKGGKDKGDKVKCPHCGKGIFLTDGKIGNCPYCHKEYAYVYDKKEESYKNAIFQLMVKLFAKMCASDGKVTEKEVERVKYYLTEFLKMSGEKLTFYMYYFDKCVEGDWADYEIVAADLVQALGNRKSELNRIMYYLIVIANEAGGVHKEQSKFISKVHTIFEIPENEYTKMRMEARNIKFLSCPYCGKEFLSYEAGRHKCETCGKESVISEGIASKLQQTESTDPVIESYLALLIKIAKADGNISRKEAEFFKRSLAAQFQDSEVTPKDVKIIFNREKTTHEDYEQHIHVIKDGVQDQMFLKSILKTICTMARVEGKVSEEQKEMINRTIKIFAIKGLTQQDLR